MIQTSKLCFAVCKIGEGCKVLWSMTDSYHVLVCQAQQHVWERSLSQKNVRRNVWAVWSVRRGRFSTNRLTNLHLIPPVLHQDVREEKRLQQTSFHLSWKRAWKQGDVERREGGGEGAVWLNIPSCGDYTVLPHLQECDSVIESSSFSCGLNSFYIKDVSNQTRTWMEHVELSITQNSRWCFFHLTGSHAEW